MSGTENDGAEADGSALDRKANRPLTRPIELASLSLAYQRAARKLKVFLAGPFIEKGGKTALAGTISPAALLRHALLEHLEVRNEVSLGEHRGILELASEMAGGLAQAALAEIALIKTEIDAVVVIPASAGSFCEIGAWAQMDKIARKMLVLADKAYESDVSYFTTGVVTLAKYFGAHIAWVDYGDHSAIKKVVDTFLAEISGRLLTEEIIRG